MLLYLGWIVAAFLAGVLIMCVKRKKLPGLKECCFAVESFRGSSYRQILSRLRRRPDETCHLTNGAFRCRWEEPGYFIVLSFDADGICLGVVEESY